MTSSTSSTGVTYESNAQYAARMERLSALKQLNRDLDAALAAALTERESPRVPIETKAQRPAPVKEEETAELPPATIPERPRVRRRRGGVATTGKIATAEDFGLRPRK